jgi:hypothetical protein
MASKTEVYIQKVRSTIKKIKAVSYNDNFDSIQKEINQLSQELDNPTLPSLSDLVDCGKRSGFHVSTIESRLINY